MPATTSDVIAIANPEVAVKGGSEESITIIEELIARVSPEVVVDGRNKEPTANWRNNNRCSSKK